jgi:hypothetical protein
MLGFDRRWWFVDWVWPASDEEEIGFFFFPSSGNNGNQRRCSANWVCCCIFLFFLALCFVFISSLCIFLKMLMCHVVIGGQFLIAAALIYKYMCVMFILF